MTRGKSSEIGRRALIGGAAGGLAAIALRGIAGPEPARAANGDPLIVGAASAGTLPTILVRGAGQEVRLTDTAAVEGTSNLDGGFSAVKGGLGSSAVGGRAVLGQTAGLNSQVAIEADGTAGNGEGIAVRARTKNGVALYGESLQPGGYGLQVKGRAVFSRSGRAIFASGQTWRIIENQTITATTIVVATIQGDVPRTWVRSVQLSDAQDSFIIRLNRAAPPGGLIVGYFMVN